MRHTLLVLVAAAFIGALSWQNAAIAGTAPRIALNRTLPDVNFANVSLVDAIDFLRDISDTNIHVNWRALEQMNVTRDTTINLKMRGVPLRKVLTLALNDLGVGNEITFYIDEGVIEITTRQLADAELIMVVYPVDDLLMDIPDFEAPKLDLQSNSSGSGSSSSSLGNLLGNDEEDKADKMTKAERADELLSLIMETIQPNIWRENGGPASIRYYRGSLIVTAPRSVHEALGGRRAN